MARNATFFEDMAWTFNGGVVVIVPASQLGDDGGLGPFHDTGIRNWSASAFSTTTAYTLTSLDMRLGRFAGTTGTIRAHIYAATGDTPTGASLGVSTNTVDISTLDSAGYPNGSTPVTFTFAGVALSASTRYAIVLECPTFAGVAYTVRADSVVGPAVVCSTDGVTWGSHIYPDYEFYFVSYGV